MQVETNTIKSNHSDGKVYLILFLASLLFTVFGVYLFIIPITASFASHFPDVAGYLQAGYPDARVVYENVFSIASSIPQLLAYIFFVCAVAYFTPNIFIEDYKKVKSDLLKYILMVVGFSVLLYISNIVVSVIYALLGNTSTSANQLAIYGMLNSSAVIPTILLVVVFAPIVEELIFRKFMFGFFNKTLHLPDVLAFLVSACVFALIHVASSVDQLVYFPMYFVMALVLVGAYLVSGKNIYVTIVVHMINNFISVVAWMLM